MKNFSGIRGHKKDSLRPAAKISASFRRRTVIEAIFSATLVLCVFAGSSFAQGKSPARIGSHSTRARGTSEIAERKIVELAIGVACTERESDPRGSMAIDDMQARPSIPTVHPEAIAGAVRAERLLPVARALVVTIIRELAADYGLSGLKLQAASARVQAVKMIRPDMDARDNASVRFREPHTINFGTIFLSGLRSDEAMISVLAHELTHIADGKKRSLQPLYRLIARRAADRTGLRISDQRSEELACDLVGVRVAREFISRTPRAEPLARRLARSIEHNCVDEDLTDDDHLSPRNTMRALLELDLTLARELSDANVSEVH